MKPNLRQDVVIIWYSVNRKGEFDVADNNTLHMVDASDSGNGFMKVQLNNPRFIFPSIMSDVLPGKELEAIDVNDIDNVKATLANFIDKMDVKIQSPAIRDNGRYFVGPQASISGTEPINYNVKSSEGKSESDIGLICLFSIISYYALSKFFENYNYVPANLNVVVDKFATALPIDEIKIKGVQQSYAKRFADYHHQVTINNFSTLVHVDLSFKKVFVDPEGVAVITGLIFDPERLNYRQGEIFDDLVEEYALSDFTGEDILKAGNVLIIDIGDGTIDFAVTNKGIRVPNQNRSILNGVGISAENAIDALRQKYPVIAPMDRQTFIKIANRNQGPNDKESKVYKSFLDEQTSNLERQIIEQVRDFHRALHGQIGMIVLCGGGANVLKNHFHDRFKGVIQNLFPFNAPYILWVRKKYAQTLNLDGLVVRAKVMK